MNNEMRNVVILTFLAVIELFSSTIAEAYPTFIGYGYTTCTVCHYNPYGNGPLTDYGRALSATAIAARPPYSTKKTTDEKLGAESQFLADFIKLPELIRPSLNYRGLYYATGIKNRPTENYITMKADAAIALQFVPNEFFIVASIGYTPIPEGSGQVSGSTTTPSEWISREHYVAFKPSRELGFYMGMMDVVYGIRIPDHIAFSRSRTLLAQNDQTHGALIHYLTKKYELGLHGFLGNQFQEEGVRISGVSVKAELEPVEKLKVGASFFSAASNFRGRWMTALHGKVGFAEGSGIITEFGITRDRIKNQALVSGVYGLFQSMHKVFRGFHLISTFEYYTHDLNANLSRTFRITPGIQYFPMQRLEMRLELQSTRILSEPAVNPDAMAVLAQFHVWF